MHVPTGALEELDQTTRLARLRHVIRTCHVADISRLHRSIAPRPQSTMLIEKIGLQMTSCAARSTRDEQVAGA